VRQYAQSETPKEATTNQNETCEKIKSRDDHRHRQERRAQTGSTAGEHRRASGCRHLGTCGRNKKSTKAKKRKREAKEKRGKRERKRKEGRRRRRRTRYQKGILLGKRALQME
jgi:hypothetical protein